MQTSLKNHKWATYAKEWPTRLQPGKKIYKKNSRQKKTQDLLAGVLPPHVDVGVGVEQHVRLVGGGGAGGGLRSLVNSNPELPRTGHLGNNKQRLLVKLF
jgi:hypothetical protein